MAKCIKCGEHEGTHPHYGGGMVCDDCIGYYFQCPDCDVLYDWNDPIHYDAGGFCPEHIKNH